MEIYLWGKRKNLQLSQVKPNKKLVFAPAVLGRLNYARSSLHLTAPQQKRYAVWRTLQ